MENQANMNAYNAQMQNQGGGLGSILGTGLGMMAGGFGMGLPGFLMGGGNAVDVSNWG
jgi:hypothetical protein